MLAERLEQPADETIGRPVGEPDLAARLADPEHFGRGLVLVGVNITPKVETTTSKLAGANGSASASASRKTT